MGTASSRKAIVTVGLGFGDEGKGATVDYVSACVAGRPGSALLWRGTGGTQRATTRRPSARVCPVRRRYLCRAQTYLGPRVIISPTTMLPEAEHLRRLGVADPYATLSAHPDCLVSTVYHVGMNRLREMARREQRHGSCGLGIGEARSYWLRYGQDAVFAQDLKDRRTLSTKLTLLRDRFLLEMQELSRLDEDWATTLHETMPAREADMLLEASQQLRLSARMPDCRVAVFEGAKACYWTNGKVFIPTPPGVLSHRTTRWS